MDINFPSLGRTSGGLNGIFIGDTHNNIVHIRKLKDNLPNLASQNVKCLFLEYSYKKDENVHLSSVSEADDQLKARNFKWNVALPRELYALATQASKLDIKIYGMDDVTVKSTATGPRILLERFNTRTGDQLNRGWTTHVKKIMSTFPDADRRFAIFAGATHGHLLKKMV